MGAWVIKLLMGNLKDHPSWSSRTMGRIMPMGFTETGSYYEYGHEPYRHARLVLTPPTEAKALRRKKVVACRYGRIISIRSVKTSGAFANLNVLSNGVPRRTFPGPLMGVPFLSSAGSMYPDRRERHAAERPGGYRHAPLTERRFTTRVRSEGSRILVRTSRRAKSRNSTARLWPPSSPHWPFRNGLAFVG